MTDRKKLEEAISFLKSDRWYESRGDAFRTVVEAAEAYLASLPKPMWKVRVWMDLTGAYEAYAWPTMSEANVTAAHALARCARKIEIEAP